MHKLGESIPFALSESDHRVYEPRAVPLGKRCGCVCPGCRQPVYAKHCLSEKRAPHFAHTPGSDCTSGYETAVHLAAKQLIEARGMLLFPALSVSISVVDALGERHTPTREIVAAGQRTLTNVVLEEAMGQIRPDVRVDTLDLGTVLVEVAVTHFVDEIKLARIVEMRVGAIEIDLSTLRDATFSALESALFHDATRTTWLHHPQYDDAARLLQASIQDKLDAAVALAAERARIEAEQERIERTEQIARQMEEAALRQACDTANRKLRHEELRKASAFKARPEDHKRQILLHRLGVPDLPAFLAADVGGALSFGVKDPLLWQTTFFGGLIHQRPLRGQGWVKREYAMAWMRYRFHVAPGFSERADNAVDEYLQALCDNGALMECKNDFYAIAVADLASFEALHKLRTDEGFDPAQLRWAAREDWPDEKQVRTLIESIFASKPKVKEWLFVTEMLPGLVNRPPLAICDWAGSVGGARMAVLEFLVRAGFVKLPLPRHGSESESANLNRIQ